MITSIILLLLVVVATGASVGAKWDEEIIGGNNTTIEEHPYQVSLQYNAKHYCGGSILTPNYILTAAHCVYEKPDDSSIYFFYFFFGLSLNRPLDHTKMAVRVGSTRQSTGGQLLRVSNFLPHENYVYVTGFNDIAILKLDGDIVYGSGVQPIGLVNFQVKGGEQSIITGWGHLNEYEERPDILQSLRGPVMANKICQHYYEEGPIRNNVALCVGYVNSSQEVYLGDFGGPLVFEGMQIGVASFISEYLYNHNKYVVRVFVNVFDYRDWIAQTILRDVFNL